MNTIHLANVVEFLRNEIDQDLQLNTLQAFLFVGQRGSCTQKELEDALGGSNASASRNVAYWTDRRFDRKPGMDFIRREEDDYDRRFKRLTLTRKGAAFWKKLQEK